MSVQPTPREQPARDVPLSVARERAEATRAVLRVAGDVDAATVDELRSALDAELGRGVHDLVLDVAGVTFLGSSGLALLVEQRRVADDRGGRVCLVAPPRCVLRPLTVTGIRELFTVRESLAEALTEG